MNFRPGRVLRAASALETSRFVSLSFIVNSVDASFCTCFCSGRTLFNWHHCSIGVRPNNAFKPKLHRYASHMAEKACHVPGYAVQFGLT